MKRIYSLLAAIMMLSMTANAQFQWGIEGGLNLNKISLTSSVDNVSENNRTGFFIGPKVKLTIPVLGLGVDGALLFSNKDAELKSGNTTETKTTNYLEIPVNLRYQIGLGDLLSAYIATGPQWNVLLNNRSWEVNGQELAVMERSTFSWNVGIGIMALTHLQVGVTYNIPISKSGEGYFPKGSDLKTIDMKNNTWQLRLAYYF